MLVCHLTTRALQSCCLVRLLILRSTVFSLVPFQMSRLHPSVDLTARHQQMCTACPTIAPALAPAVKNAIFENNGGQLRVNFWEDSDRADQRKIAQVPRRCAYTQTHTHSLSLSVSLCPSLSISLSLFCMRLSCRHTRAQEEVFAHLCRALDLRG